MELPKFSGKNVGRIALGVGTAATAVVLSGAGRVESQRGPSEISNIPVFDQDNLGTRFGPLDLLVAPDGWPSVSAVADFNLDNSNDVVAVNRPDYPAGIPSQAVVFSRSEDGRYSKTFSANVESGAADILTGDFDQRYGPDFVFTSGTQINFFLNKGDGTFDYKVETPGGSPTAVARVEIQEEGRQKTMILAANWDNPFISRYTVGSEGTIQHWENLPIKAGGKQLAAGKLAGDENIDIARQSVFTGDTTAFSVLEGDGRGNFKQEIEYPPFVVDGEALQPDALIAADLTSAPADELAVAGSFFGSYVGIYERADDGRLVLNPNLIRPSERYDIGDLSAGKIGCEGRNGLFLTHTIGIVPGADGLYDVDNDGDLDYTTVDFYMGRVSTNLQNQCTPNLVVLPLVYSNN